MVKKGMATAHSARHDRSNIKVDILSELVNLSHIYGSIYRLWIGKELFTIISNPDDTENGEPVGRCIAKENKVDKEEIGDTILRSEFDKALKVTKEGKAVGGDGVASELIKNAGKVLLSRSRNLNKPKPYQTLVPLLGSKGLITSDADTWKIHRKKMSSSFHVKILENSVSMMVDNARLLNEHIKKVVHQPDVNIRNYVDKFVLDILCEIITGIKSDIQFNSVTNITRDILEAANARMLQPWYHIDFIFKLSNFGKVTRKLATVYRNRQKQGQDAPSSVTTHCLYELSRNQRVQDKLIEELKDSVINKNSEPTFHDYMNLKYLDLVIKETMRMYPPAVVVGRQVDNDVHLPSGYLLPANTSAFIFIYNMHRDEKYYSNPNEFIPERFENIDEQNRYTYIPFSTGIRNCIGQKFGLIETKILVSNVLLKYHLLPGIQKQKIRLEIGVVLRAIDAVLIKFIPREL
ncbi:hypothetical protein PGB90_002211 [Kerria lacca]